MKKKLRPKRFKQPIIYRLGAAITYIIPILETLGQHGMPIIRRYAWIDEFVYKIPLFRHYLLLLIRFPTSPFVIFYIYNRLFLRKSGLRIKLPYFIKHHLVHAIMLPIVWSVPEQITWWFFPPTDVRNCLYGCKGFLLCHTLLVIDFATSGLRGLYLEKGILSEAAEYHTGTFPKEELEEVNEKGEILEKNPEAPYGLYQPPQLLDEIDILEFENYIKKSYELDLEFLEEELNEDED